MALLCYGLSCRCRLGQPLGWRAGNICCSVPQAASATSMTIISAQQPTLSSVLMPKTATRLACRASCSSRSSSTTCHRGHVKAVGAAVAASVHNDYVKVLTKPRNTSIKQVCWRSKRGAILLLLSAAVDSCCPTCCIAAESVIRLERHASPCSLIVAVAFGLCSRLTRKVDGFVHAHCRVSRAVWIMDRRHSDRNSSIALFLLQATEAIHAAAVRTAFSRPNIT